MGKGLCSSLCNLQKVRFKRSCNWRWCNWYGSPRQMLWKRTGVWATCGHMALVRCSLNVTWCHQSPKSPKSNMPWKWLAKSRRASRKAIPNLISLVEALVLSYDLKFYSNTQTEPSACRNTLPPTVAVVLWPSKLNPRCQTCIRETHV